MLAKDILNDHLVLKVKFWLYNSLLKINLKDLLTLKLNIKRLLIFNYVNKALFYTNLKKSSVYFIIYDSILFLNIIISSAYIFCTFTGCSRTGFFNSNILKIYF